MNTSSDRFRFPLAGLAAATAAVLAACIQGPWDYYPKDPPIFRGITVMGYALADKPLEHVCFERLVDLDEESTQAFAFYDSADVRIKGSFAGVERDLALTAVLDTPNCFKGDTAALIERGKNYEMTASITWDSAGTKVTTVVRGTAMVPTHFEIHDSAAAPKMALQGRTPGSTFSLEFIRSLDRTIQGTLLAENPGLREFVDSNVTQEFLDTSTAFAAFLKANGQRIQSRLKELIQGDQTIYKNEAKLFYLGGELNTLSHYYSCDRSEDVGSVLITQQFDPAGSRPETAFDSPLGQKPKPKEFYFPGNHRRLLIYPDAKGSKGWNLLDSMGVVNTWFHTLRNRLHFYGMEDAYYSYLSTVMKVDGGDPGEADPRIVPKFNVTGAHGIFVGGIADSFDLFIEADSLTKTYSLPEVHGLWCRDKGWLSEPDCRNYYREWCGGKAWATGDCRVDVVMASLEADFLPDIALKARVQSIADTVALDTVVARIALNEFCVNNDFRAAVCAAPKITCLETSGRNACKEALWNYCLDNAWRENQCKPALASYCHDKPRLSEVLCRQADKWCADPANAGSLMCK